MSRSILLACAALALPTAAVALDSGTGRPAAQQPAVQQSADLPDVDVKAAVGEIGPGWVKKNAGEEGVTFVCESDACGGRGVVGVGQAKASPDYVKTVVADPKGALTAFRYATEESMKPSGCTFKTYDMRRLTENRIQYEGSGACRDGGAAAMTTIFDADRSSMMSVQILTKSEADAVKLRDASIGKIVAALDRKS